jgi:hypothetical protein
MNQEMPSLDNLQDIVLPGPPAIWPPAPGVWVVLVMVVLAGLMLILIIREVRRRGAYRRAGLKLLDQADTVHDVSVSIKRVALAVFSRREVASLYGEEWVSFLNRTCPGCDFGQLSRSELGGQAGMDLFKQARRWVKHHRRPGKPSAASEG